NPFRNTLWKAQMSQPTQLEPDPDWEQVRPLLDQALETLPADDRDAVLLRYFDRKELAAVGDALGLTDDAARKRVSRALARMRDYLARRGLRTTEAALGTVMATNAVHAAPAGLATSISAVSLATTGATGTLFSLKLLPTIAMTKSQAVITAALLAAGVATPFVWLHRQLDTIRAENTSLRARLESQAAELATPAPTAGAVGHPDEAERLKRGQEELLRLRGEVAQLRRDNVSLASRNSAQSKSRDRLTPSSTHADFVPVEQYVFSGYATPQAALQSYFWALENPQSGKLLESLALPVNVQQFLPQNGSADLVLSGGELTSTSGTADSTASERQVISLSGDAQPLGLTKGYRSLTETDLADGRKQIEVEREFPDGTVRTETHTLAKVGDDWKVEPGTGMQIGFVHADGNQVFVNGGGTGQDGAVVGQQLELRVNSNPSTP
ncbi:MAG TPA: hypothetical protein DCE44_15950, partial [Verrucomicrobiales bacterium]|nr:hypothetical protein [Verrucomicrobiales bacterium]